MLTSKVLTLTGALQSDLEDAKDEYADITQRIAEIDADEIKEASDGMGTDETKMARVICSRMKEHVEITDQIYQKKYGMTLEEQVRGENKSILGLMTGSLSHFGRFLTYRCMLQPARDAFLIHKAMNGMGCSDYMLVEILSTRTNEELQAAAEVYAADHDGESMRERIEQETGGFGKKWYEKWMDELVCFVRDEGDEVDDPEGKAQELYDAGEGKFMGCDEQPFIDLLVNANNQQCAAIVNAYEQLEDSSRSLISAVEKKMGGDLEFAVLARIKPRIEFFAHRLFKACKGWGTDEECVGRVIACCSKQDIKELEVVYNQLFEEEEGDLQTLRGLLESELSGDFLDAILFFLETTPPKGHEGFEAVYDETSDVGAAEFGEQAAGAYQAAFAQQFGVTDMHGALVLPGIDPIFISPWYAQREIGAFLVWNANDVSTHTECEVPEDEGEAEQLLEQLQAVLQDLQTRTTYNVQMVDMFNGGQYQQITCAMRKADHLLDRYSRDNVASMEFSAQRDARLINEAVEGFGTDEDKLIGTICCLPKKQLLRVSAVYEENYGSNLYKVVDSELGGIFEGNLNYFMKVLLTDRAEFDAGLLMEAMKGWGTNDSLLCEVVGTRSNLELLAAKAAFLEISGGERVESMVDGDTSGDYKDFLLECLKCRRSEGQADSEKAQSAAGELKEALEGWGVNCNQDLVRDTIVNASPDQMQAIRNAFDGDLVETIKDKCKTDWGLPNFAAHLDSIQTGDRVVYSPPEPPPTWE